MAIKFPKSDYDVQVPVDTSLDVDMGRNLLGSPTQFDDLVGERLLAKGLAAKTDDGWVRGYKWHEVYGG